MINTFNPADSMHFYIESKTQHQRAMADGSTEFFEKPALVAGASGLYSNRLHSKL